MSMGSTNAILTHCSLLVQPWHVWLDVPQEIRQRLADYGIHGPADWRRLTRSQRGMLFGIVPSAVKQLDAIVRGAR
jgi:hypothetical protein